MAPKPFRKTKRTIPAPYRSHFEVSVADHLLEAGVSFVYEKETVAYIREIRRGECQDCSSTNVGQRAFYTPDFVLANGIFIEAKGKFDARNRTKLLAVLRSNNQITRENFRILFQRDNYTTANKRETYMDWCDRHEIIGAIGPEVPAQWIM